MRGLLVKLILKALPLIVNMIVDYLKKEAEKRERERRARDVIDSKDEDEFDRSTSRLP